MTTSKIITMRRLTIVTLVLLVGCLLGQMDQWSRAETAIMTFPYEMSTEQTTQFLAALTTLKVGDTYEQVISILGTPFKETTIRGKKIDDPVRGTSVTYYLSKIHATMVNEKKDKYVLLAFDSNKKLVSGWTNIAGLSLSSDLTNNWPGRP